MDPKPNPTIPPTDMKLAVLPHQHISNGQNMPFSYQPAAASTAVKKKPSIEIANGFFQRNPGAEKCFKHRGIECVEMEAKQEPTGIQKSIESLVAYLVTRGESPRPELTDSRKTQMLAFLMKCIQDEPTQEKAMVGRLLAEYFSYDPNFGVQQAVTELRDLMNSLEI